MLAQRARTSPLLRGAAVCFVKHDYSSFGKQILDISEADTESVVDADRMADDLVWIAVYLDIGYRVLFIP